MFLSYISSLKAQDLLVTIQQDTLNCKIVKLTDDFYPVEFKWDDTLMSGTIHQDSVLYYRKNIFRSLDDDRLRPWYSTVSLDINVGGGRQFGQLRVGLTADFKPQNDLWRALHKTFNDVKMSPLRKPHFFKMPKNAGSSEKGDFFY